MRPILIFLGILTLSVGWMSPTHAQTGTLLIQDTGCTQTSTMAALDLFIAAGRHLEAAAELRPRLLSGECRLVPKGTRVTILATEDTRPAILAFGLLTGVRVTERDMGAWFQYAKITHPVPRIWPDQLWVHAPLIRR
jgi:hypothetical protein